jgi:WD40 repeat protein
LRAQLTLVLEDQRPQTRTVFGLAFAPDGQTLATVEGEFNESAQRTLSLRVWDTVSGKQVRAIKAPQGGVSAVAFAPDGKTLAYASGNTIVLCDPKTGHETQQIKGPVGGIVNLAFAPDGKALVSKGADEVVRLWEVETGKENRQLGMAGPVSEIVPGNKQNFLDALKAYVPARDLAFAPDGQVIAAAGGTHTVRLWQAATGDELPTGGHCSPIQVLAAAPDGKTLVSQAVDGTIRRWEAGSGKQLSQISVPEGTTCLAFAPDAQTAALGNKDKTIRIVDLATGKELRRLSELAGIPGSLAFSRDGKRLALRSGSENVLRLFDLVTGAELKQIPLPAEPGPVRQTQDQAAQIELRPGGARDVGLAFSPDGSLVVVARAGTLLFAEAGVGKVVRKIVLPGQRNSIVSLAFAPDGRTLATENADRTLTLWEVASGQERAQLGKPPASPPPEPTRDRVVRVTATNSVPPALQTLAFSPDGRLLACRNGNQVEVWDLLTHREVKRFQGHEGKVEAVTFTADGKTVASGSSDTTILLWDVGSLKTETPPRVAELPARELEELWADLAGDHAGKAFQSMQKLATAPRQVVSYLRGQLKPAAAVDPNQVERWIADLDSEKVSVRKQAEGELEKLGDRARLALEKVLTGQPSLETRKRVDALLETATSGMLAGEPLRLVRAVELLEQLGTPEARQILEALARGAPGALPTRHAQASLDRLAMRR